MKENKKKDILEQRSEYVFNFALENWYKIEEMRKYTAKSEFIELVRRKKNFNHPPFSFFFFLIE